MVLVLGDFHLVRIVRPCLPCLFFFDTPACLERGQGLEIWLGPCRYSVIGDGVFDIQSPKFREPRRVLTGGISVESVCVWICTEHGLGAPGRVGL